MSNLNERPAAGNGNIALWVLVPFVIGVLADVATNYYFALPHEPFRRHPDVSRFSAEPRGRLP